MASRGERFLSEVLASKYLILPLVALYLLPSCGCTSTLILCLLAADLTYKFVTTPAEVRNPGKWKAVIVGAGFSGLCMAKRLVDVGIKDFVILEKASGLGGTWNENTYPGIACDVSSHEYSYSFFTNPWWSRAFSGGTEIWNYLHRFTTHFNLQKYIQYNQKVTVARWNEKKKVWEVETEKGDKFEGNFFIHATGGLHKPHRATFKNQELFKKPIFHTAEWDSKVDITNKRVGVIGTGATSVQLVPNIADRVKELHLFQRTPGWVPPRRDFEYYTWVKHMFNLMPWTMTIFRYLLFLRQEFLYYAIFVKDSLLLGFMKKNIIKMMRSALKDDPELCEALIPNYEPGCKRMTPSDKYLQAMMKKNVHLVQDPIVEFTPEGISTGKKTLEFDVIILSTGFDILSSAKSYDCSGRGGKNLDKHWGDTPTAYLGVTVPEFPNHFILLGPSTALGHNSVIFMIECQVNYALDCIRKVSEAKDGQAKSIEAKASTLEAYISWQKVNLDKTAFHSGCKAWYQNKSGYAWILWPKSCVEYWWSTYSCKEEDYTIQ